MQCEKFTLQNLVLRLCTIWMAYARIFFIQISIRFAAFDS